MSLMIQLVRAYRFSSIELTVHQLRRSLLSISSGGAYCS
ncbi:hypothetical protein F383_03779 [Gossypium arboreum]|uniref:Uncharacterized protein n=1 Tax=Gossypium arboreum TaxID=29729 RepID=A0A0B0P641_GOSAR|nr:hypothetical protein F383_03779 [Gossypium arboreum]